MSEERTVTIHDLPAEERPRERLEKYGAESLSTAELLAILLRVGIKGESAIGLAERLLHEIGGLSGLAKARLPQLAALHGFGLAKAAQLQAALELGKRVSRIGEDSRPSIRGAADASRLVMEDLRYLEQETLVVLFLDTRSQLIRKKTISVGTLTGSPAHPAGDLQRSPGPQRGATRARSQPPQRRPHAQSRRPAAHRTHGEGRGVDGRSGGGPLDYRERAVCVVEGSGEAVGRTRGRARNGRDA